MTSDQLQAECERGQAQLMRMEYREAEATLAAAERVAWMAREWDALSRLYMPLQEARRQRRQRCGEGTVCLDLSAESATDHLNARHVVDNYSHGQLLVAGWGSIEPALRVRELADKHGLYLDTFLAAVYPSRDGRIIAIIAQPGGRLPDAIERPLDDLMAQLPPGSTSLRESDLPRGSQSGTYKTFGLVMALWEKLHTPFLAAADAEKDPIRKIEGYRNTIAVDYACELAHQKLSDVARQMMKTGSLL